MVRNRGNLSFVIEKLKCKCEKWEDYGTHNVRIVYVQVQQQLQQQQQYQLQQSQPSGIAGGSGGGILIPNQLMAHLHPTHSHYLHGQVQSNSNQFASQCLFNSF